MTSGATALGRFRLLSRSRRIVASALLATALVIVVCALGLWLRTVPAVQDFIADHPGVTSAAEHAPAGIPAWAGWQHALNVFFLALIVRTGLQVRRTARPTAYWSRRPGGRRISLSLWLHLVVDVLWLINGAVFVLLLVATGRWVRILPLGWDAVPNALSVAIQYASLDWPHENGWVAYNALQQFAYAGVILVLAPLAVLSGVRMSPLWPRSADRIYPVRLARAVHFPVMLAFAAFAVVHVTLVLATGALRNLNHMYASADGEGWAGLFVFTASAIVTATACALATPTVIRSVSALTGTVSR